MKNSLFFKIYIFLIIIVSLAFIGFNILAQVETETDLKQYVKEGACPNFIDITELTMKDSCTGLVWARHELPTYHGVGKPGYTWQQAVDSCSNFIDPGLFRLPTVEELLSLVKYQCDQTGCEASLARDLNNDGEADFEMPFFANATYWSINDFNEPASWTNPAARPAPGQAERDYKRSVNLSNGEVDSPVFSKNMRLNSWCVIDRDPQIIEKNFIAVSTAGIDNGTAATGGQLKTIYNRQCSTDDDCDALSGTVCENGFCTDIPATNNIDLNANPVPVSCDPNYHLEYVAGETATLQCVSNPNTPTEDCPSDEIAAQGIEAYEAWKGNSFNGYRICRIETCSSYCSGGEKNGLACDEANGDGDCPGGICMTYHVDPETELCVPNRRECLLSEDRNPNGWTERAVQDWDTDQNDWGPCYALECSYAAEPVDDEGDSIGDFNYDATCQCVSPNRVAEEICTACAEDEHYDDSLTCVSNIGDDCSTTSEIMQEEWQGGLFSGFYECTFVACQPGYHQANPDSQTCVSNTRSCDSFPAFAETATQTWDDTNDTWGSCQIESCTDNATAETTTVEGETQITSCTCPTGYHGEDLLYGLCSDDNSECYDDDDCSEGDCQSIYASCVDNIQDCNVTDPSLNNDYYLVSVAERTWNVAEREYSDCYPTACQSNNYCIDNLSGMNFTDTTCNTHADCTMGICYPSTSNLDNNDTTGKTDDQCVFPTNNSLVGNITDAMTGDTIGGATVFLKNQITEFTNIATISGDTVTTKTATKTCSTENPTSAADYSTTTCTSFADCQSGDYPVCSLPLLSDNQIGYNYMATVDGDGDYSISGIDNGLYKIVIYKNYYFKTSIDEYLIDDKTASAISQDFQLWSDTFTITITDTGVVDDYFRVYIDDNFVGDTSPSSPALDYVVSALGTTNQYKVDIYFLDSDLRNLDCMTDAPDHDHVTGFEAILTGAAEFATSPASSATNNDTTHNDCLDCFTTTTCTPEISRIDSTKIQGRLQGEISVYDTASFNDSSIIPENAGKATLYVDFPFYSK